MLTKILIIRLSSIGDIVLTTPVVRQLKQQLEGQVEIHFLTKSVFAPMLEANPHVSKVWQFDGTNLDTLIASFKAEDFDYLFDLHKNIRSAKVKNQLKLLTFTFDKLNWEKWLLVNLGINKMPDTHIVDRYLESAKGFALRDDGRGLDYFIPDAERVDLKSEYPVLKDGYLVWVLGAAHPGKRFSASKSKAILGRIEHPIVLIGGVGEETLGTELQEALGERCVNLCNQLSIHGSASVIEEADVVLSPDTGMMHIAAALKKDVVSFWGCTVPELGMYPYRPGDKSVMIQPQGLSKRPCSKLGDRCKYKGYCINQIDDAEVIRAVDLILG